MSRVTSSRLLVSMQVFVGHHARCLSGVGSHVTPRRLLVLKCHTWVVVATIHSATVVKMMARCMKINYHKFCCTAISCLHIYHLVASQRVARLFAALSRPRRRTTATDRRRVVYILIHHLRLCFALAASGQQPQYFLGLLIHRISFIRLLPVLRTTSLLPALSPPALNHWIESIDDSKLPCQ